MTCRRSFALSSSLAVALAASACGSSKPAQVAPSYDEGFLPVRGRDVALVGPVREDRAAFERIKELEEAGALSTPDGLRDLRATLRPASQSMIAATAPALFRAGVFGGSPELIDVACESLARVTHAGLRRTNGLARFEEACSALSGAGSGSAAAPCRESAAKLVRAYAELREGDEKSARRSAAEGLRRQASCPDGRPLARTPVAPDSRGFIVVVALQAMQAAPAAYLGNESAPRTADAVNAAFAENARLIKAGMN